ncbi:hypothetical protein M408DRAFT_75899 [Serendipita vermifera MAFF 305830]|uniref:Defective in cullin neddylation protein n=1 Tax=Serendipita vermifera MAFF 305830 TaxID=933852 RepID=A0A0C3AIS7_SERVB|nr:hypothetical protein M408DRAFT_75899 [Serendipita vermifera MAFF 305830]
MDNYYANPPSTPTSATTSTSRAPDVKKIGALFDSYKGGHCPKNSYRRGLTLEVPLDSDTGNIGIDGTLKLCEDLGVNPEDVVMLAVAYELKSPGVGEWTRQGWVDGWKNLQCDQIQQMKAAIAQLSSKLSNDTDYFRSVYNFTFDFAKTEAGQRSIPVESAVAFWGLLLPAGLKGRALQHMDMKTGDDGETVYTASRDPGWNATHSELWSEYMNEKGGKGVSKDTWMMFFDFVRTIDAKFEKYDADAAWPSAIDDFAEWAKEKLC